MTFAVCLAILFYRMGADDQTITAGQRVLALTTAHGDVVSTR